jgi:chromate transport protein ChrA
MEEEISSKFHIFLKKVLRNLKEFNTIAFLIGTTSGIIFIILLIHFILGSFFHGNDPFLGLFFGGIAIGTSQILIILGTRFIQKRITKNESATSSNLLLATGAVIFVLTLFIFLAILIILAAFFGFCLFLGVY